MKKIIIGFSILLLVLTANAEQYNLPGNGSTVGDFATVVAKKGDTLNRMAVRHGVGYNEMAGANPKWKRRKIPSGTELILPTKHHIPQTNRSGIVINLADLRLFYYPPGGDEVETFPVAVGKRGWSTPKGKTSVIAKIKHPTWTPPASIRREAARKGRRLKKVYRAGPNNPLGTRALRLGISGYLIHGTNKPWSIGKRVSHGCIRMRRADIERLYSLVSVNTPVTIVNESNNLSYPDSPAGGNRAYAKTKNKKANRSKKTRKKSTAKKRSNNHNATKRGKSYVNNNDLDYNRLLKDIEVGTSQPIDLSGI